MTVIELSQLQSLQSLKYKTQLIIKKAAYGNAVNSEIIKLVAKNLII